jgi:hypothetical protein
MQLAQVFVPQSLPFSANSTRLLLANDNMRFGEDKTLPPNPNPTEFDPKETKS